MGSGLATGLALGTSQGIQTGSKTRPGHVIGPVQRTRLRLVQSDKASQQGMIEQNNYVLIIIGLKRVVVVYIV